MHIKSGHAVISDTFSSLEDFEIDFDPFPKEPRVFALSPRKEKPILHMILKEKPEQ